MIDTHCHLADKKFGNDVPAVLARARETGVDRIITIADSMEESRRCIDLSEKNDDVFCAVGVHPHNAKEWREGDRESLLSMIRGSEKVRAVGEIGLDYHYDFSPRDLQGKVFEEQLLLAKESHLPAVVHNRESIRDLRRIIEIVRPERLVLHCCTEKFSDVAWLLQLGYSLSFTGIATYPDAEEIRETIRRCPLAQLMIETDAPYLAPVPHRGKRNEPSYIAEVARLIAQLKGLSLAEVDRVTTENAIRFFEL
jgi:TatD DNase family protein